MATSEVIHIKVTPMGKPRMTRRDVWQQRDVVMRYRAYGDELRLKLPGYEVPEKLHVVFNLPMPASWSQKKKQAMNGQPHKQKPDIDNLVKAFMDHLAKEDSYVWSITAEKYWAEEGSISTWSY